MRRTKLPEDVLLQGFRVEFRGLGRVSGWNIRASSEARIRTKWPQLRSDNRTGKTGQENEFYPRGPSTQILGL